MPSKIQNIQKKVHNKKIIESGKKKKRTKNTKKEKKENTKITKVTENSKQKIEINGNF